MHYYLQDDYQCRHVHIAAIFNNRASKSSIIRNWKINKGFGYYIVPRNRELPYSGWRTHHIKHFSKIDTTACILYESGQLPTDNNSKRVEASEEEKKRKQDDIFLEMRQMYAEGRDEDVFAKYPRNTVLYGPRIKALVSQKSLATEQQSNDPHIWLYGYPGTGKTSILQYVYPNYYKKNLHNKFFDLYDEKVHTHIILEDLDHEAVERLSINFLKTLCDKQGFAVDQKYQTPNLTRTTVLVTSNFDIGAIMPDGKGVEENKAAMLRRFFHVRIDNFLRLLQLKIIPKWDQKKLLLEGNSNMGKLFVTWDYITDKPLCEPVKTPEEYQDIIRKFYYS